MLKHIDLEKICRLFDIFFTQHGTYDYLLPVRRLVAYKDDFNLYDVKLPFKSVTVKEAGSREVLEMEKFLEILASYVIKDQEIHL